MEDGLVTDGESLVGTGDLVLEPESPEFVVPVALSKKEKFKASLQILEEKYYTIANPFSFWISYLQNLRPLSKIRIYFSNFEYAIFVLLIVANIVIITSEVSRWDDMKRVAKAIGTLAQYNFAFLMIPVTRTSILLHVFRISFENVIIFHRWLGRWICALTVTHGILFTILDWGKLAHKFLKFDIMAGIVSTFLMIIIVLTSFRPIRRYLYYWFFKIHILLFLGIIISACLHKHGSELATMIAVPLGLYVIDVSIRIFLFVATPRRISSAKLVGDNYVRLFIHHFSRYSAAQHVNLYIPQVGWTEAHSFSPISNPENDTASIIIEVKRKWTKKLKKRVEEGKELTLAWIDGPFGQIDVPFFVKQKYLVFVAGGVGIAPIMSVLHTLHYHYKHKTTRAHLIWSCRAPDLLIELAEEIGQMMNRGENLDLHLQLYHTGEGTLEIPLENATANTKAFFDCLTEGRPDFPQVLKDIKNDAKENHCRKAGMFICGSGTFRDAILRNIPHSPNCFFNIHSESFSL